MTSDLQLPDKFIQIDLEGYFHFGENRVNDTNVGLNLFNNLKVTETGHAITSYNGTDVLVEAFDQPLVAHSIDRINDNHWEIQLPYGFKQQVNLDSLCLDEWDRFLGETTSGIPFVLNRSAQANFFNLVDDYDDDSITIGSAKLTTDNWLSNNHDTRNESFWTDIYQTEDPGWDLKVPHPCLQSTLNQLKLNKCRILNLGCGTGTDAHFFASLGHIVTGVDFSPEAISQAKKKYEGTKNLNFIQKDVFDVTPEELGHFDLIYEHTLYCAISPDRRNALKKKWLQMLTDKGQLLGVFFTMHKRFGPPFGGSEWEIQQRLKKDFRFLYWTRSKLSPGKRMGKELIVFAEKI